MARMTHVQFSYNVRMPDAAKVRLTETVKAAG
jgi:hypothetical protein